jgi:hypothetical protein
MPLAQLSPDIARAFQEATMILRFVRSKWAAVGLTLALAAIVYSSMGFYRGLDRNTGAYLYSGQQAAEGIPPYVSIFLHKGPLGSFLAAVGVALAYPLGLDDVLAVRIFFCVLACLTTLVLFLLGEQVSGSRRVGFLAALTFLSFYQFNSVVAAGPEPKTPLMLFVVSSLYLTSRRKWFWAGVCGALSGLVWQPTAAFLFVTLILAALQPRQERVRAIKLALAGGVLPLLATVIYFAERRALYELVDRSFIFNVFYLKNRQGLSTISPAWRILTIVWQEYRRNLASIAVGFCVILCLYARWAMRWRSLRRVVVENPLAPILLSLPAPIIWSLKDFQGIPDFYIFLPYVSIGMGLFVDWVLRRLQPHAVKPLAVYALLTAVCLSLLLGSGILDARNAAPGLIEQERTAREILDRFGRDVRVHTISYPQALALLHTTTWTPYWNLKDIFDVQESHIPGGFDGWMQSLAAYDPQIIIIGRIAVGGANQRKFNQWMASRYTEETIGAWAVHVKNADLR